MFDNVILDTGVNSYNNVGHLTGIKSEMFRDMVYSTSY